jgi:cobalamin biosynthesis protein CobT
MRTGLVGEVAADAREPTDTVLALMRAFMRDALVVAGRCALARRRRRVRGRDMRAALMYSARTFFERDDAALGRAVAEEARAMADEDGEEDSSAGEDGEEDSSAGEDGEEDSSAGEDGDEDSSAGEDGEEDSSAGEDGEDGEEPTVGEDGEEPTAADRALAAHVERIVETWPLWAPTDPVHALIKRAIDHTPV